MISTPDAHSYIIGCQSMEGRREEEVSYLICKSAWKHSASEAWAKKRREYESR
jgi:hypothetical protein